MHKTKKVSPEILEFLRRTDTCSVSNAIETFGVRTRNEGYVNRTARCIFPKMPPVAGYAVTGRIRTSTPPIAGLCYYHRKDWWQHVAELQGPKIIVMADGDSVPGVGAFVGEMHAQIAKALGCVAYVSNGTIRDVPAVEQAGFPCFADGVSVSHAYAHIVEFGEPVEIGGLKISPGDLLHGDLHGVQSIPMEIAGGLPAAVAEIDKREAGLRALCNSPEFSLDRLADILEQGSLLWQPRNRR